MLQDEFVTLPPDETSSSATKNQGIIANKESTPYGITYVNAQHVPDANSGSRRVCIIDTGYDRTHPDLQDNASIVTGRSFVGGHWFQDYNGHGTHVAGTIAAIGGNGKGVKGVVRNGQLKLHIGQALDASGSGTMSAWPPSLRAMTAVL